MADLPIQQAQGDGYCVYFADRETDHLIKVGFSSDVQKRIAALRAHLRCEVYLLGAIFTPHRAVARKMERNILSALGCTFKGAEHEWLEAKRGDICRIARVFHRQSFVTHMVGFSEDDEPEEKPVFLECMPKALRHGAAFRNVCSPNNVTATARQQRCEALNDERQLYARHEGIA